MTAETELRSRPPPARWLIAAGLAGAVVLTAIYGIVGFPGNRAAAAACADARASAERIAPLARGEVAAVGVNRTPLPLPQLTFVDASGAQKGLGDFRGRTVLLNLWATWCVPCRKEMPALDALQAKLGGADFQVVAVNIDTRDSEKPKAWLRESGITGLDYYSDPSAKVFQDLKAIGKAFGMPTTVLIAPSGCEIASLAGPAEWASEDALALVRAALGPS